MSHYVPLSLETADSKEAKGGYFQVSLCFGALCYGFIPHKSLKILFSPHSFINSHCCFGHSGFILLLITKKHCRQVSDKLHFGLGLDRVSVRLASQIAWLRNTQTPQLSVSDTQERIFHWNTYQYQFIIVLLIQQI